ncbi:carboxylesterase/lipase family protein [Variovorax sp. Sphag1AA]|uniref:carboxylesterase/lipase family protein n=1 Tax=Variovorax sp. Sphag1AA TaxID=2587027 RepID=UPI001617CF30|nr:carboxylesterase family protein [Variovorax sp. Sphag1AA]MBB3181134.1 para-nitrobenzyl esterase [Variovorax sp. Sphag1AA]
MKTSASAIRGTPKTGRTTTRFGSSEPIVDTTCGTVRGVLQEEIYTFKGVPYGADTGGANRFQPAKPIAWPGIRDALDFGHRSPQDSRESGSSFASFIDPSPMSEDCLALNIFTPSIASAGHRLPVMVYLHGGAFRGGSAGAPFVNGANLARKGVVIVSLNHRLNLFGHLYLGNADGGKYIDAGNVGMLDIVTALRWVRDNISQFGGDPGNVTIFGQSGGGSKVAVLMAMPSAHGLFHKAIIQSSSSALRQATIDEAERNTYYFLAELGLDRRRLAMLHEIPAAVLVSAMLSARRSAGRIDNYRPVVDGRALPCQPFEEPAVRLSSKVPLMTGWCENEQRLLFSGTPAIFQESASEALSDTARVLRVSTPEAQGLMNVYHRSRPADTPGDTYCQVLGDLRYRRTVLGLAERQIQHGGSSVHVYLLKWKTPVRDGLLRSPHTLCIPFAFANIDIPGGITGSEPDRYVLQEEMSEAWVAFAHRGNPNHSSLPYWRPYSLPERSTMVFDSKTFLDTDPLPEERSAFEAYPRYVPAIGEG